MFNMLSLLAFLRGFILLDNSGESHLTSLFLLSSVLTPFLGVVFLLLFLNGKFLFPWLFLVQLLCCHSFCFFQLLNGSCCLASLWCYLKSS